MLRPATPISILLFAAFALLLLSTISTPIVKAIPLATYQGVDFGVFGYCKGDTCSGFKIGYSTDGLFSGDSDGDFSLPSSTRHSLSAILIVHPIAAFLTLVLLGLALAAHFHSPSHSSRYLLVLLVFALPTFLVSLLAFLVDILLFAPHLQWGGWIVLAATIIVAVSGILLCAVRRTMVSRKAHKKRIAEEADSNNLFNLSRQGTARADSPPPLSIQPKAPMVNGAPGADKLPSFATFDTRAKDDRSSNEERIPLNPRAQPMKETPNGSVMNGADDNMSQPMRMDRRAPSAAPGGRNYNGPRDEYGNPLPPSAAFGQAPGMRRDYSDPALRNQYVNGPMGRGGAPLGPRGRGGYPMRGGYGRGGAPPPGFRGPGVNGNGRGISPGPRGPPPGYGYNGTPPPGVRGNPGPYDRDISPVPYGVPAPFARRPSDGQSPYRGQSPAPLYRGPSPGPGPDGYGRRPPPGPGASQFNPAYGGRDLIQPGVVGMAADGPIRRGSPAPMPTMKEDVPIGQAVEMDATSGSPANTPRFDQTAFRDSDGELAGMVGLQQNRQAVPPRGPPTPSVYSQQDGYVPPRTMWGQGGAPNGSDQPAAIVELPAHQGSPASPTRSLTHHRTGSDNYYEDVDPRFAESDPLPAVAELPATLSPRTTQDLPVQHHLGLDGSNSYEDLQEGARSPAESDNSHFTSVSQRGINPNWRPGPGFGPGEAPGPGNFGPRRSPGPNQMMQTQMQRDLLSANPDFELPNHRPLANRGAGPRAPGLIPGMQPAGAVPPSRYPGGQF